MCLEVPDTNSAHCSHEPGDEFFGNAMLPAGERIEITMKIVRV